MFRQLYDFGHGHRTGEWSPLMAQVVSNLYQDDMLAIVAYLASIDPRHHPLLPFQPRFRSRRLG
jgi:cytochrome c553